MLKLATLFSGVGTPEYALQKMGISYDAIFGCEINEKSRAIYLANFWETIPLYHDITTLDASKYNGEIDVLVGGSPCQPFSLSGMRGGFEDTRGTLFFDYARVVKECQPKVFVYENVRGLTNHDKGKTFTIVKNTFRELGYTIKYQIVNTKDYGIPQHRERIYIIGVLGDDNPFEFPAATGCDTTIYDYLDDEVEAKYLLNESQVNARVNSTFSIMRTDIQFEPTFSRTLRARDYKSPKSVSLKYKYVTPEQVEHRLDSGFNTQSARVSIDDISPCLLADDSKNVRYVGLKHTHTLDVNTHDSRKRIYDADGAAPTLTTASGGYHEAKIRQALADGVQFRNLTPREYYRLQGFGDDFILPPHIANTHLYSGAGNSMSVNILEMIFTELGDKFLI